MYTDTNYTLLGLVIEHVRGRPLADVLRDGVLRIDGMERLVYQPDEAPTEPMAMPEGESRAASREGRRLPPIPLRCELGRFGGRHRIGLAFSGALVAGVLRRRDRLRSLADRDDDVRRRPSGYGLGLHNPATRTRWPWGTPARIRVRVVGRVPARGRLGRRRAEQSRGRGPRRDGPPSGDAVIEARSD